MKSNAKGKRERKKKNDPRFSHNRVLFDRPNDRRNQEEGSNKDFVGGTRALRTRHTLFYTPLPAKVSGYATTYIYISIYITKKKRGAPYRFLSSPFSGPERTGQDIHSILY